MTLKIRNADADDTLSLSDILQRALASSDSCGTSQQEPFPDDLLVAERDGKPIGFAGGTVEEDQFRIEQLFIVPEAVGQGIGLLLLTRLTDLARHKGINRLSVAGNDLAIGFFEKHGFSAADKAPHQMASSAPPHLMEKHLPPVILPVNSIHLHVDTANPWAFETDNRNAIDDHWRAALSKNPHLWNGRVLKLSGHTFENGSFRGTCKETSFAAFLAWRDWGAPDASAHNVFGSAILRSNDGALLFGVMSDTTANAGKIYPPGGNLDPADVIDGGQVDVAGAIFRELVEETGIEKHMVRPGERFAVFDGPRISIAQLMDVDKPADQIRREAVEFSLASEEQELADLHILRRAEDAANPDIVSYARAIAHHLLMPKP
ncbi:GNAT family N-acetyltransferase [Roseibium algae]|uniref:GNAT family N-acetyltransferase n=1 Tax=Roseibium algae TaxID=3123038 RepID=A0ABU8TLY6_9HYPH